MSRRPDVIVVGLGAAGGIVAAELAAAGATVVGLDKGPAYTRDDFRHKHDELRYYARGAMLPRMPTDPMTWRASGNEAARVLPWASGPLAMAEPLHHPPSLGTGGGTIHWGGSVWRNRSADFRMRSAIIDRFGKDSLPEHTKIVDWPITYDDLEPYYDQVEWTHGTSGQAGNIQGELVPGGNPFEAPRSRDYPMPPLTPGAGNARFVEACTRLGYHPFPQAAAIASQDYGEDRHGCTHCGFCHGFPCHVGAKTSTQDTSIRAAIRTGNFHVRAFSRVYAVNRNADGRVRGVSYYDAAGKSHDLEAEFVVLACYSLENARLLLASDINASGQVGKYFMTHNYGMYTGVVPEYTNPFMGSLSAGSVVDDFNADDVPDNDEGVVWGAVLTNLGGDIQPMEAIHNLPPYVKRWGSEFKDWIRTNYRRLTYLHTQTASLPDERFFCDLDPTVRDAHGQPALRITHDWSEHDARSVELFMRIKRQIGEEMDMIESWAAPTRPVYHISTHEVGVHRMGDDPRESVVDRFGETHECPGLFAVGGGQFPTLPGSNPTHTIMALAYMSAESMVRRAGATPAVSVTRQFDSQD
jgi:gluconate 2-dehydrogenase alpha chain